MKKFEKMIRNVYNTANDAASTVKKVVDEEREKAEQKRLQEEWRAKMAKQAEIRRRKEKWRKYRVRYICLMIIGTVFTVGFFTYMIHEEEKAEQKEQERIELQEQKEAEAAAAAEKEAEEAETFFNALEGSTLEKAIPKLEDEKYAVTYLVNIPENEDTELIESLHKDELDDWIVDDIEEYDTGKKTARILVKSEQAVKAEKAQETLNLNFPSKEAVYALENYGESLYPYGFDMHTFIGIIDQEAVDEDTWFIKAEVTITNAYGTELDTVCEGEVSGSSANPEISNFYVY